MSLVPSDLVEHGQVSRYECGLVPLTDIAVLRRFADALAIAPQLLGLSAEAARPPHLVAGLTCCCLTVP
jgi:hypothetical protein